MDSFYKKLIDLQRELAADLDSDRLPQTLVKTIGEVFGVENIVLIKMDGESVGPWAEQTEGWKMKSYSLDVIRKAIQSEAGFAVGGTLEGRPSESQAAGNIHSCIAARIDAGKNVAAALYCDVRSPGRRFVQEDGVRLKLIGEFVAVYVKYLDLRRERIIEGAPPAPPDLESLLIGEAASIRNLRAEIRSVAPIDTPVLIYGETGTGKEVVAQAIHLLSGRRKNDFVAVHCAAINEGVFESELFGHEKGAFSGAYKKRQGKILQANNGTLFLDEVADIPVSFQTKLLRVLETHRVTPVGSDYELGVNFRLITATNKDIKSLIGANMFREDLHYRISDIRFRIPPLRERLEDVPILARHFAGRKHLTDESMDLLMSLKDWPGNVRQLKKIVENACKMTEGIVVPREAIAKQLQYQDLEPSSPLPVPESFTDSIEAVPDQAISFDDLKRRWQDGGIQARELEERLNTLYGKVRGSWRRVAKQLGVTTDEEMRSFRNWVYYLQRTGVIRRPPGE